MSAANFPMLPYAANPANCGIYKFHQYSADALERRLMKDLTFFRHDEEATRSSFFSDGSVSTASRTPLSAFSGSVGGLSPCALYGNEIKCTNASTSEIDFSSSKQKDNNSVNYLLNAFDIQGLPKNGIQQKGGGYSYPNYIPKTCDVPLLSNRVGGNLHSKKNINTDDTFMGVHSPGTMKNQSEPIFGAMLKRTPDSFSIETKQKLRSSYKNAEQTEQNVKNQLYFMSSAPKTSDKSRSSFVGDVPMEGVILANRKAVFHKTRMCPRLNSGVCLLGSSCTFAHSIEELRPPPNLDKTKLCPCITKPGTPCPAIGGAEGDRFAHSKGELRHTSNMFKTNLCLKWARAKCKKGALCNHAHGQQELKHYRLVALSQGNRDFSKESEYASNHKKKTDLCGRNIEFSYSERTSNENAAGANNVEKILPVDEQKVFIQRNHANECSNIPLYQGQDVSTDILSNCLYGLTISSPPSQSTSFPVSENMYSGHDSAISTLPYCFDFAHNQDNVAISTSNHLSDDFSAMLPQFSRYLTEVADKEGCNRKLVDLSSFFEASGMTPDLEERSPADFNEAGRLPGLFGGSETGSFNPSF